MRVILKVPQSFEIPISPTNASPKGNQYNNVTDSLSQKIFEQFFIIGVPPECTSSDPKILAMYPSTQYKQTDADLERLIQRCFPSKIAKTNSKVACLLFIQPLNLRQRCTNAPFLTP